MAPAQIVDITASNTDKYKHKKFEGKRSYAHKKFGTRINSIQHLENTTKSLPMPQNSTEEKVEQTSTPNKRCVKDIFRPYALPDRTTRKRKHHEIQNGNEEEFIDFKRFASTPPQPSSSSYMPQCTLPNIIVNPMYNLHHYQFNPQTFALILQKQRAALYMGEILKRQGNFNIYNLMGE